MPQFLPTTSSPTPPMPLPQVSSSTMDDGLANLREEMAKMLRENFGVELPRNQIYQKPYPEYFDAIQCPPGYKIPDFVKFNGEGTKTTWEHVSQYLAQLSEAGSLNELKVRLFPLSLTGTAFSWFSSLPHGSIRVWSQLEQKFHDHFYSGDNELKLSHLTSVKQKHDESVSDYVKRFRETKNRCFSLVIIERDLANLVLSGLRTPIREKLEGYEFLNITKSYKGLWLRKAEAKISKKCIDIKLIDQR